VAGSFATTVAGDSPAGCQPIPICWNSGDIVPGVGTLTAPLARMPRLPASIDARQIESRIRFPNSLVCGLVQQYVLRSSSRVYQMGTTTLIHVLSHFINTAIWVRVWPSDCLFSWTNPDSLNDGYLNILQLAPAQRRRLPITVIHFFSFADGHCELHSGLMHIDYKWHGPIDPKWLHTWHC